MKRTEGDPAGPAEGREPRVGSAVVERLSPGRAEQAKQAAGAGHSVRAIGAASRGERVQTETRKHAGLC